MQNDEQLQSIVDQKRDEESLRQIELIVENSRDAIISETLDGIITTWNGGAAKMFGYSAEEIIGKPILLLYPPELKDGLPALLDRIKAGEVIPDYDSVRIRKDQSKVDVAISISPIKEEDGTVIGISSIQRDVTERREEEESLRQSQLIVENSHDAIIGVALEGIVTSWNKGAKNMFGYFSDETVGKSMANLFPPELKEELPKLLEKVSRGEVIADYDTVWLRKDAIRVDVEFSLSPVYAGGGAIIGVSLVGRDISIRKKNERQIRDLNEGRNKFINIISHQLRTPLTVVNWNLESILEGNFGNLEDLTRQFLQATYKESVEITHRIYDLLTAMDVDEGRVVLQPEEASIDSIVAAVMIEMEKKAELKGVSCQYISSEKDIPALEIDIEKIRVAITKLVENSIIYTKEGGTSIAKLSAHDDIVRFEVTDTGIGIPEQEQHHIFTRFFRASNATTMQPDSFGLGLFITQSFITQHGGSVGFESKEGEGSTFWFEIPLRLEGNMSKEPV